MLLIRLSQYCYNTYHIKKQGRYLNQALTDDQWNPIEFIWKSIKRVISRSFIKDLEHMERIILENFLNFASQLSFAEGWIKKFLEGKISSIS